MLRPGPQTRLPCRSGGARVALSRLPGAEAAAGDRRQGLEQAVRSNYYKARWHELQPPRMGTLLGKEAAAEQADPTPAAVPAHPGAFPGARQRLSRGPPERRQQMGWRRSKAAARSPFCCFASWKEGGSGTLLPLAPSCTWRKTLRNVHGAQGARGGRRQRRSLGGRALSAGGKPAAWPLLLGSRASRHGLSPPGGSLGRSGGVRRAACAGDLSRLRDRAPQCVSGARVQAAVNPPVLPRLPRG